MVNCWTARDGLRITVVFNNVPFALGLTTGWGLSCLVEGAAKTMLFDTGANGIAESALSVSTLARPLKGAPS